MTKLKRLVVDVLKPNEPSIVDLSKNIGELKGVEFVDITVSDVDRKVEKIKIVITGNDLHFGKVKEIIEKAGATIHSVDRVSSGRKHVDLS